MMGSTCSPSARSASIIMCRASNARSDSGQGAQIYQCKADAEGGLAWILREQNVASAIVGASRPEQLDENAGASGLKIDPALFAKAEAIAASVTPAA